MGERYDAFAIIERDNLEKKIWLKVGSGFVNNDGSINVKLDAVPADFRFQLRLYKPDSDDRHGSRRTQQRPQQAPRAQRREEPDYEPPPPDEQGDVPF